MYFVFQPQITSISKESKLYIKMLILRVWGIVTLNFIGLILVIWKFWILYFLSGCAKNLESSIQSPWCTRTSSKLLNFRFFMLHLHMPK